MARLASRTLGILQIVLSGAGFGLLGVFGKAAFKAGLTGGENLALRFLFSSALLLFWLALFERPALKFGARTLGRCAALGILGYAVFSSCYFAALEGLSASLTVLLLYTYPVFVAVFARLFFGQRLARRTAVALPVVMTGLLALVSADLTARDPRYLLYGVASGVLYALYIVISSRVLNVVSPVASVAAIQGFAGLALAALHLRDPARVVEILSGSWPLLLAMALVSTAMPMVLFIAGLQKLDSAEVSLLSTTEPVTGVALATIILGERLTAVQWLGAAVIVAALVYMARGKRVITAAATTLALFCMAPDAPARTPAKKRPPVPARKSGLLAPVTDAPAEERASDGITAMAALSYEGVDFARSDPSVSLDGFGASVLGQYEIGLFRRRAVLPLGGGFHYVTLGGSNAVARLDVAIFSLVAEAAPAWIVAETYRVGGFLAYDFGLFGRVVFATDTHGTTSRALGTSSRVSGGLRFLYQIDARKAFGGDLGLLSGGYRVEDTETPDAVRFTGRSLRALFSLSF